MKTFHLTSTTSFGASFNRNANTIINIKIIHPFSFIDFLSCSFSCLYFVQQTEQYLVSHLLLYSEADTESCSEKLLFGEI